MPREALQAAVTTPARGAPVQVCPPVQVYLSYRVRWR
jgi:hypothetical protein